MNETYKEVLKQKCLLRWDRLYMQIFNQFDLPKYYRKEDFARLITNGVLRRAPEKFGNMIEDKKLFEELVQHLLANRPVRPRWRIGLWQEILNRIFPEGGYYG